MKTRHLVYPLAPRRWMPPAPSMCRLDYALKNTGTVLHPTDLTALHESLLRTIEAGTVEAANNAVEVLRKETLLHRKRFSRKKLEGIIASYLGSLNWETRVLQMTQEPVPVSPGTHPSITWWREKNSLWARFVYRITGKLEGLCLADTWREDSPNVRRVRILTQGAPASATVNAWKDNFLNAHPGQLSGLAYRRENAYGRPTAKESPSSPVFRALTHYIILEAVISREIDHLEGEPLLQRKLRRLHSNGVLSQILPVDNPKQFYRLPVSEEEILTFADCQEAPDGSLQPWPLRSKGWTAPLESRTSFNAITDLSLSKGKRNSRNAEILVCERFGVVPDENKPAKGLTRLLSQRPAHRTDWQEVVQASPFYESIHTDTQGLLLTRPSGEVVRFAPWDTSESPHFRVEGDHAEKPNALALELALQAHAEGKRVLVYSDHERWANLMETLTPGEVLELNAQSPCSLNPFSDVNSETELQQLLPAFVNITYDLLGLPHNLAADALNKHFVSAWKLHGADLELKHVANQFRPFGNPAERSLQAALDNFVHVAGPWQSGRSAGWLKPGITCINGFSLTRPVRFTLCPILGQLVTALAYRNAVNANKVGPNGSLTLISADYLEGARNRAEVLAGQFSQAKGSIGLFARRFWLRESGLLQSFRASTRTVPRLCVNLAQDTHGLHREGLDGAAQRALPATEEKAPGRLAFAVLRADDMLGSFTLERAIGLD